MGENWVVRIISNCECLAESMLHDLEPINVHGAFYLKTFKPLHWRLHQTVRDPPLISWAGCYENFGRMENPEIRIRNRNRNRNRNRKRKRNWRNKWMLQVGKYDSHQNSSSLLCIPRKMDDDTRNSFKKRYVYIEHSSYHSLQLNWVTQNIFAFVGHNNTGELVEMWIRVKNFWLHNLCKTKTLTL